MEGRSKIEKKKKLVSELKKRRLKIRNERKGIYTTVRHGVINQKIK